MAPLRVPFGRQDLAPVTVPLVLAYGSEDQVLIPEENAARIAPLLKTLTGVEVIQGAGHCVFLAPCARPTLRH